MRRFCATSSNFMPRSSRISAFARRAMRCSSSPSLAIFTRSARSAGSRKFRFAFIRRLESIQMIRSNDSRKSEESRYKRKRKGKKRKGSEAFGRSKEAFGKGCGKKQKSQSYTVLYRRALRSLNRSARDDGDGGGPVWGISFGSFSYASQNEGLAKCLTVHAHARLGN